MKVIQNIFLPNAATSIGAFEAESLTVETVFTTGSLDQRAGLLAGACDVAVTALDNLFDWNRPGGGFMWTANVLPFLPEEVEWNVSFHPDGLPDGTVPTKVGQQYAPKRPGPPDGAANHGGH